MNAGRELDRQTFEFFGNTVEVVYRTQSLADKSVIHQIVSQQDYNLFRYSHTRRLMNYYRTLSRPPLIVDAGAHIGVAALYFLNCFKQSILFAIEPDPENFDLLLRNTSKYENCMAFKGAITNRDQTLYLEDPGQGQWGYRVVESGATEVTGINIESVLSHPHCREAVPFIIKIDIEGGEERLFASNTDWMKQFPVIIIELHDWLLPWKGSSTNFFHSLPKYNFDFIYQGENIFLFNRDILVSKFEDSSVAPQGLSSPR